MLSRNYDSVDALWFPVFIFNSYLALTVRAEPVPCRLSMARTVALTEGLRRINIAARSAVLVITSLLSTV